jgi:hypothetical protein
VVCDCFSFDSHQSSWSVFSPCLCRGRCICVCFCLPVSDSTVVCVCVLCVRVYAGNVLDPVRLSIVCNGPSHMLDTVRWFLGSEQVSPSPLPPCFLPSFILSVRPLSLFLFTACSLPQVLVLGVFFEALCVVDYPALACSLAAHAQCMHALASAFMCSHT